MTRAIDENHPSLKSIMAIAFCSCLGPFAANTYLPAFHQMGLAFSCPTVDLTHSLAIYLVTFAVSSLFVGALSDAKGRIPVFMGGMLLFIVACWAAMTSTNIYQLYFWRALQGLGASVGPVITQAMVRDQWHGKTAMRVTALMAVLFGLAPAFAPVIGGQLVVYWGWQGVFAFLGVLGVALMLVMGLMLHETLKKENRREFCLPALAKSYVLALKHPAFMFGAFAHGLCFMGCILFAAGASDIVMNILGMGVTDFGYLTMPLVFAGMFGAYASSVWVGRYSAGSIMRFFMPVLIAVCTIYLVATLVLPVSWALVIIGPLIYQFIIAVVRPVIVIMNLDYFPKARGMASSVLQFFHTGAYAVTSAFWIPIIYGHYWAYAAVMLFTSVAFSLCWVMSMTYRKIQTLPEDSSQAQRD